ncbi:MAG: FecR domain-containing protein [Desulfobacterales bacterium]|nr:FecR domain-containing protein [Desulfobacterales bacterium]
MKNTIKIALHLILIIIIPCYSFSDTTVKVEIGQGKAEITHLNGSAFLINDEGSELKPLANGNFLEQGNRVKTKSKARIELKLPDKSFVRFDEDTVFQLKALSIDEQKNERNIKIEIILGNTWAKVASFFGSKDSNFELFSKVAVAGVRGTTYRANIKESGWTEVKVYGGEVAVSGIPQNQKADSSSKPPILGKPTSVQGPTSITGPKSVSPEEWTYIVRSMQQIVINPDGAPTKPFRFSPEADMNDWVKWNQMRDSN